jgi:hypothetical protein
MQSLFVDTYETITIEAYMVDINADVLCSFHRTSSGDDKGVIIYGPHHRQQQLADGLKSYFCYVVEGVPPPALTVRDTETGVAPHIPAYAGKLRGQGTFVTSMVSVYIAEVRKARTYRPSSVAAQSKTPAGTSPSRPTGLR